MLIHDLSSLLKSNEKIVTSGCGIWMKTSSPSHKIDFLVISAYTRNMRKQSTLDYSKCTQIANQCTCMHVRKASRAVTQYFDRMISGCGLTNSQFTMLTAFALTGKTTVTQMSEALGMDRTTLSRNLKPLLAAGLIKEVEGVDKRVRHVMISEAGKNALMKGIPLWEKAQEDFIQRMGQSNWKDLLNKLSASVVVASNL